MQPTTFGVSFSLHRCRELGLDPQRVLLAALKELGFRRFRLMSYWNLHEPQPGQYNFDELDRQFELVQQFGGSVSLAVGKRQPRWPECHIPDWALDMPAHAWYEVLYAFIQEVVERYKDNPALESYQLENEALLKDFGVCKDGDYSHERLRAEFERIKQTDSQHPVIMTLSDSWGFPFRAPVPDVYAMSLYRTTITKRGTYSYSKRPALFYELRHGLIQGLRGRPVFIHELQAEPWLSRAVTEVPVDTQLQVMNAELLSENIAFAKSTNMSPIDLWGLEWWYWLRENGEAGVWETVKAQLNGAA